MTIELQEPGELGGLTGFLFTQHVLLTLLAQQCDFNSTQYMKDGMYQWKDENHTVPSPAAKQSSFTLLIHRCIQCHSIFQCWKYRCSSAASFSQNFVTAGNGQNGLGILVKHCYQEQSHVQPKKVGKNALLWVYNHLKNHSIKLLKSKPVASQTIYPNRTRSLFFGQTFHVESKKANNTTVKWTTHYKHNYVYYR